MTNGGGPHGIVTQAKASTKTRVVERKRKKAKAKRRDAKPSLNRGVA
jgi:hypothetical protein